MLKTMVHGALAAAAMAGAWMVATPAAAQEAPVNGVLYIYGNEKCPTDKDGREIVVCERRSAAEKYRLPKDLRPSSIKPQYQSWAQRQQSTLDVGQDGIGTCTTVGAGGSTGCTAKSFAAAKAERRAQKRDDAADGPPR
jgi:hypothetical protein